MPINLFKKIFIVMLFLTNVSYGIPNNVIQTKNQLQHLDKKIKALKYHLASVNGTRGALTKSLAGTERELNKGQHELHKLEQDKTDKQQKIVKLNQQITTLSKTITAQQTYLASHVRAYYRISNYQPVEWLLNRQDPHIIGQLLIFYQYTMRSRAASIEKINQTKKSLGQTQANLHQALTHERLREIKLTERQTQLERHKHQHAEIIQSLDHDIENQQKTLQAYEENKKNLSHLLSSLLVKTNISYPNQPFLKKGHKLPRPVHLSSTIMKSMNQGVTIFGREGTPIYAVYPGKIVFSDWLNGYGLLIIIDHGQGFMTLYANNKSLYKAKGAHVLQGEPIASMGHSGGVIKQNGLYFEIRQRGKAIPPLPWLA